MMRSFIATCAITAQCALAAPTAEQMQTYADFANASGRFGLNDWTPYEVTASDGAITTVFQIRDEKYPPTRD